MLEKGEDYYNILCTVQTLFYSIDDDES